MSWAVDEVIEVPESAILRDYGYTPNRDRQYVEYELPEVEPYLGHESLLVRTAIVRSKRYPRGKDLPVIDGPDKAAHLCHHLTIYDQEHMVALALDAKTRITAIHETAIGGRSSTSVAALDVIKVPIMTSSIGLIVVHNHPSGDPTPSESDRKLRHALDDICSCVGLSLLDFLVVAQDGWHSLMAEEQGSWEDSLLNRLSHK
jgi:DNA repair protein RadC